MYQIKSVQIDGFWGDYSIKTDFFSDVNIFIGDNGTGKTTFINILNAVLTFDLEQLSVLYFSQVRLTLRYKSNRILIVRKVFDDTSFNEGFLEYKIERKTYKIPMRALTLDYRRMNPRLRNDIDTIRTKLRELVNVSYLSVYREIYQEDEDEIYHRRAIKKRNTVDLRLEELMDRFASYQLQLESELGQVSKKFQQDVLKSMLYNEKFDDLDYIRDTKDDLSGTKKDLLKAYQDLGVLDEELKNSIDKHIRLIKKAVKKIRKFIESGVDAPNADDVTSLSVLKRTKYVISLSNKLQKQRAELFALRETYLDLLSKFIKDKKLEADPQLSGRLLISKNGDSFPIEQLSSGEKQLIILLTEALLQDRKKFIYITDEPELSLHVAWQKMILPSVRELNSNAQMIVATHSLEIAGHWRGKIINMENILKHG